MTDSIPTLGQVIEPPPVPFTFEAPGWYVAGGVAIILLLACAVLIVRHSYKNRYRRIAVKRLLQQQSEFVSQQRFSDLAYAANMLMKQICIRLYSRDACADLRGKEWLKFLNKTSGRNIFEAGDDKILTSLYLVEDGIGEQEAKDFVSSTIEWIKKHKHHAVGRSK